MTNRTLSSHSLLSLMLALITWSLFLSWSDATAQQNTAKIVVEVADQIPVIEEVTISGSVISTQVADLATEVSGLAASLAVDSGDRVNKGDVLLSLDSELQSLSLAVTRAATEQAKQEKEDAKRRLANAQALAKRQTVSDNEMQSLAAEVRIKTAAYEGAQAEEQRQQALLQRYTLRAPFSGVVSHKYVEIGEWVQVGTPVFRLVETDSLHLDFHVPQVVYSKLKQIESIDVSLDALAQRRFEATLEKMTPIIDTESRTFLIRVSLADPLLNIVPGMSASALMRLNSGHSDIVVSRDALLRLPDGRISLWVVDHSGSEKTVTERQVITGLTFGGNVVILKGLAVGEQVVVQGNEALREGQTVSIVSQALKD